MLFLWFLLLLAWPAAEIAVFIFVGQHIGWLQAILLTFATAVAGTALMRIQGFAALNRFLQDADKGELPIATVLDAMGIFAAGLLLLLPGFLSDIVGLLLFIPPLRRALAAWLFRQILKSPGPRESVRRQGFGMGARPRRDGFRKSDNVVDAEFETVRPEAKPIDPKAVPDRRAENDARNGRDS
jgi:UPF0716 protein FxsA